MTNNGKWQTMGNDSQWEVMGNGKWQTMFNERHWGMADNWKWQKIIVENDRHSDPSLSGR